MAEGWRDREDVSTSQFFVKHRMVSEKRCIRGYTPVTGKSLGCRVSSVWTVKAVCTVLFIRIPYRSMLIEVLVDIAHLLSVSSKTGIG